MSTGYQFEVGRQLRSATGKAYKIVDKLGVGLAGVTYRASLLPTNSATDLQEVVVKTPLFDPDEQPLPEIIEQQGKVFKEFFYEWNALARLQGLDCAAEVLDYGTFEVKGPGAMTIPAVLFMVQRYISGVTLDQKMLRLFPSSRDGQFRGVPDGDQFIDWAIRITRSLSAIHQRQVVHGDIHQENVMIDARDTPVFIDFGQALLRDIAFPGEGKRLGSTARFVPPEKTKSISGDIFSLGGVLCYLATGELPPEVTEKDQDIDVLKQKITNLVRERNEELYRSNRGVIDVIARCMRFSQEDRITNTDGVLDDLESFSPEFVKKRGDRESPEQLRNALAALDKAESPLFSVIARCRTRSLRHAVEHMAEGAYDLSGDHEAIVTGMTQYLACLGPGDSYLTISLPSFWSKRNLGTNGRYLTANILAAQRLATIRRIFLITAEDEPAEIKKIFDFHLTAQAESIQLCRPVQTSGAGVQQGGLSTAFQLVEKNSLQALGREGKNNYGLMLSRGGKGLLIVPVYRNDGVIVTIQFRSDPGLVRSFRDDFYKRLDKSRPLTDFLSDVDAVPSAPDLM
ncbi:MAG TPA: protein kinase [Terriglobia bacterium]|nr:protein kinase [Terriglobia bacterium]